MADEVTGGAGSSGSAPAYGDWVKYEPDEIKRAVPLQWAIGDFFGVWDAGAEMIQCPMPNHHDDTPSFNLWSPDDEGRPMRYGCFGCGAGGDVITLIQIARDVGFTEACRIAVEELAPKIASIDWKPTAIVTDRHNASPEQLERALEAYGPMTAAGFDALLRFMRRKGLGGEEIERYAVEEWDWRGVMELGPTVLVPHRDWEKNLTGIKYRSARSDSRWNEDGSSFPALYGAWRDQGRVNVFIAEGETDTLRAAFELRDEPFDVFGLPSGANQKPTPEMRARLKDRTVYICGDGDAAGYNANRLWHEDGIAAFVVRMPQGEDILSCGIPLTELVEHRAMEPRLTTKFIEVDATKFLKVEEKADPKTHETKTTKTPVADFSFKPDRELLTEDGPAWEGHITGTKDPVVLRTQDLNDTRSFTRWAGEHGARAFTGSQRDVQMIRNWVAGHADYLPLEQATQKAGRIGRSYVWPENCIGPDRLRYIAPRSGDVGLSEKLQLREGPWDPKAIQALEQLNTPGTMAIILGWLVASLLRGKRAPAPPLFVAGESGAGKTHLIESVLHSFGFHIESALTTSTPYAVDSAVSSVVGFPVWFDEYRSGARADSMERLRQTLRDAYNGQPSHKGGMKANVTELTEVTTWAGIIVSGEMGTSETSLRDRLVYLQLDPEGRSRGAYTWLKVDKRRTAGLGHALLDYLVGRPDALFQIPAIGDDTLPDRFRETMGFVQAGWDAWLGFRAAVGLTDAPAAPDFSTLSAARMETPDPYLELLRHCEGKPVPGTAEYIVQQTAEGLRVLTAEAVREAVNAGIEIPGRSNELVAWLKRRYPEMRQTRIGGRRGWVVPGLDLEP